VLPQNLLDRGWIVGAHIGHQVEGLLIHRSP
jgi:hypothetical protein